MATTPTSEEIARLQEIAASAVRPLNTRIPVTLHEDLKAVAAHDGKTLQQLVTEILTRSVNTRIKKIEK